MLRNWHGFGATSLMSSGTVSVPHDAVNLALFFVPDHGAELAPLPCQIGGTVSVPHSRTLTGELIPSCTTCKTDAFPCRVLRRLDLTYRAIEVTTDRTHGKEER